jgi:hypothetical protein
MNIPIIGSIVFVLFINILFYPVVPGIGIGVLFFGINLYLFSVRSRASRNLPLAMLLSGLSVLFAAFLGWRATATVQAVDVLWSVFFSFAAGYLYKKNAPFIPEILSIVLIPVAACIESLMHVLELIFTWKLSAEDQKKSHDIVPLLRGLLIGLPIVWILFSLLVSADPIFSKFVGNISLSINERLIISLVIFLICFVWGMTNIKDMFFDAMRKLSASVGTGAAKELFVISLGIIVLFGAFLGVQYRYLFASVSESELHHLGIQVATYSEYVRQGFFQLLWAAFIAALVAVAGIRVIHTSQSRAPKYMNATVAFLIFEVILLLCSAFKRLSLYVVAHGMTESRMLGGIFLVWLSFILVGLMVLVWKKMSRPIVFGGAFLVTLVAMLSINILPIESIIATRFPPTVNNVVDYPYLLNGSSENAPIWLTYIDHAERTWESLSKIEKPTAEEKRQVWELYGGLASLGNQMTYIERLYAPPDAYIIAGKSIPGIYEPEEKYRPKKSWGRFVLSDHRAYQLISNQKEAFGKIPTLLRLVQARIDLYNKTP